MDGAPNPTAPDRAVPGPGPAPEAPDVTGPTAVVPAPAPTESWPPVPLPDYLGPTPLPGYPGPSPVPGYGGPSPVPGYAGPPGPPPGPLPGFGGGQVAPTARPARFRPAGRLPWVVSGAVLVVIGLVVALLVWAPWEPPAVPRGLATAGTSPTGVDLTWSPRTQGTGVGRYVVERDGSEVGSVAKTSTSFRDEGLAPGGTHTYRVIAARGSRRSPASPPLVVTLPAPSPTGLALGSADQHSAVVTWSAPAGVPDPDRYVVLVNGQDADVDGSHPSGPESDRIVGLAPTTTYSVQVQAVWQEGGTSAPSGALSVTTADPPLAQARLDGSSGSRVNFRVTATSASDLRVGTTFTDTWTLTPTCASGPCDVRLKGSFHPSGDGVPFELTLARRGALYVGSTRAAISKCGSKPTMDAVTVTLTVTRARGTDWVATLWNGQIEYRNPYVNAGGGYYCPSGRTAAAISWASSTPVT